MRRTLARDALRAGVPELDEIDIAKEAFARAQEHWRYRQVDLIDQPGGKILLHCGDASDRDVLPVCGRGGSFEGTVDSIRDEMERRSAVFAFI